MSGTRGELQVVEVRPDADPAAARAALALGRQLLREAEGESAMLPDEPVMRARWAAVGELYRLWVARHEPDGDVVGFVQLRLPRHEPARPGWVHIGVARSARGRGAGTRLLAAAVAAATSEGRGVEWVLHGTGDGAAGDEAWARHRGARPAQVAVRSVLRLPLAPERAAYAEAEVTGYAADYDLVTWEGAVPEHLLRDRAHLRAAMSTDQPMGERAAEPEVWSGERWRASEAHEITSGRTIVAAGAVQRAGGRLVAVSEVVVPLDGAAFGRQSDTLVLREHRGRRLGLAVKLAVARHLTEHHPGLRGVTTTNDAANAPMLAVNDALGFERLGTATIWRLDAGPPRG